MNPKTSIDLFNKIRSQFSNIQIGDESGVPTADPSQAVFFEFEFKELVESGKMKLCSQLLISELKDFVATGMSYKAKPGQHDDLVSSCLLMTRMMKVLADFDPKIFEKWTDRTSEWTAPMPIFANLYG